MSVSFRWCLFAMVAAAVPGQKMPLGGEDSRLLQLHEVSELLEQRSPWERVNGTERLEVMAMIARRFLEPEMSPSEDVQALADRFLVFMGQPRQSAWLEDFLVTAKEAKHQEFFLDVKFLDVGEDAYRELLANMDMTEHGEARSMVMLRSESNTNPWLRKILRHEGVKATQAPKVVSLNLQQVVLHLTGVPVEHTLQATCAVLDETFTGLMLQFEWQEVGENQEKLVEIEELLRVPDKGMGVLVGPRTGGVYPVLLATVYRIDG